MSLTRKLLRRMLDHRWASALLLQPVYLLRFIYRGMREGSLGFTRYYPGYHGSTIPSLRELRKGVAPAIPDGVDGIDLNTSSQLALLETFSEYYPQFQPNAEPAADRLYHHANALFGFNDGFVLYAMLRHFKPRKVVEVGSGYSSGLMLDTAAEHLPEAEFTFIDPYSTTILEVLKSQPPGRYRLLREDIRTVPLSEFAGLREGDIVFIDTSHVVKAGSDLTTIFSRILPSLPAGVLVHIHDIFYPWEYPMSWLEEGRAYNETYFVRAFLQFNSAFEILYFNHYMETRHRDEIDRRLPGFFKDVGRSLWLRKTR